MRSFFRGWGVLFLLHIVLTMSAHGQAAPKADIQFGINKIDLAMQYYGSANGGDHSDNARVTTQALARKSMFDAHHMGVSYLRVAVAGWGPTPGSTYNDLDLWISNPTLYWSYLDQMMRDLKAYQLKIMPTFAWHAIQFPALVGSETVRDLLISENSLSYQLLKRYVSEFITRYSDSESIVAYEICNELNLGVDTDLVAWKKKAGQDTAYLESYSTEDLMLFTRRLGALIRSLDPSKPISSGFGTPRPNAYRNWKKLKGEDSLAEFASYIKMIHSGLDLISVHMYIDANGGDFRRFNFTSEMMLKFLNETAQSDGKKLFIGELGDNRLLNNPNATAAFFQDTYSLIRTLQIPFSAPWVLEYYIGAPDEPDHVFNIEPGATDGVIQAIKSTADLLGILRPTSNDVPQVVIARPWEGARLKDQQRVSVFASASEGSIFRIDYFIDGVFYQSVLAPPFHIDIDTSALPDGWHKIQVVATDDRGFTSEYVTNVTRGDGPFSDGPQPDVPTPRHPVILSMNSGCKDNMCIWMRGSGFTQDQYIIVRDSNWKQLAVYQAPDIVIDLNQFPQYAAIHLNSPEEQAAFAETGVIITVVTRNGWDSRTIKLGTPFR